jgi:SET domain-containing protein 6
MVAFIMSYSFTEPAGKSTEGGGQGDGGSQESEDDEDEETGISPPPMMVPLADILNHVAKNNAALNFDKKELRMVSTKDIRKVLYVFL